jgi:hypothetical protein
MHTSIRSIGLSLVLVSVLSAAAAGTQESSV